MENKIPEFPRPKPEVQRNVSMQLVEQEPRRVSVPQPVPFVQDTVYHEIWNEMSSEELNNTATKPVPKESFEELIKEFQNHIQLYCVYPFDDIHLQYFFEEKELLFDLFEVIYSEYILFLPRSYFQKIFSTSFHPRQKVLSYFSKYHVAIFSIDDKEKIQYLIHIYNHFLKNSKEDIHKWVFKQLFLVNQYLPEIKNSILSKLIPKMYQQQRWKEIHFQDATIDMNVFYKKIRFSSQELFLRMEQYAIKKMEYKLRSFCQIAEELGSEKIRIQYEFGNTMENSLYSAIQGINTQIGLELKEKKENKQNIQLTFEYPTNHIHINLNKFHLMNKILSENKFLMSREEFDADVELKYFIDARCTNFIQRYDTHFTISTYNEIERKIFLEAKKHGIHIDQHLSNQKSIDLSIEIEFSAMQENFHLIDGTNIHVLREGFLYLMKMIQDPENTDVGKYKKVVQFIKSHLYAIENKYITLPYEYPYQENVLKMYKQMIEQNFKPNEFEIYLETYFQQNIGWTAFLELRDILLKGVDNGVDKIHFVTHQYIDIISNKKNIMDNIEVFFHDYIRKMVIYPFLLQHIPPNRMPKYLLKKTVNEIYEKIKDFVFLILRKSFYYHNGLTDSQDIDEIRENIFDIFTYHFDTEMIQLIKYIENEILKKRGFIRISSTLKQKISDILNMILHHLHENLFFSHSDHSPLNVESPISPATSLSASMPINSTIQSSSGNNNTILEKQKQFFVKFLIRYYQYHNQIEDILEYFDLHKNSSISDLENRLYQWISVEYSVDRLFSNYISKRLFYLYEDVDEFHQTIQNKKKKEDLHPLDTPVQDKSNIVKEEDEYESLDIESPFWFRFIKKLFCFIL